MIVAYSGAGYHGLQRNPNVRAVEDELVEAAAAAGFVAPALVADLQALWWCRCARTDKGVHALSNVISFMCALGEEPIEVVAARMNAELPDAIRVLAVRRSQTLRLSRVRLLAARADTTVKSRQNTGF